jgi:hypothetical protein
LATHFNHAGGHSSPRALDVVSALGRRRCSEASRGRRDGGGWKAESNLLRPAFYLPLLPPTFRPPVHSPLRPRVDSKLSACAVTATADPLPRSDADPPEKTYSKWARTSFTSTSSLSGEYFVTLREAFTDLSQPRRLRQVDQ